MSDMFNLRWESTNTGKVDGYDTPVPLIGEMFFEVKKESGIPDKLREFFHQQLDLWLNEISQNPDQFGSRMRAAFEVEFRGDTDDWRTVEETEALKARETIRMRLSEIANLAKTK